MLEHHGCVALRGMSDSKPLPSETTRFGRLFPELPPAHVPSHLLERLGVAGGPMDEAGGPVGTAQLPAGFVFFGQFVDHDITLDVTSSLDAAADPAASLNFRTPALDLDSVYGGGREASPYLYDGAKMLLGNPGNGLSDGSDLPRNTRNNSRAVALIGDPRNDENRIISQLQLAFLKFHNAVVDHLILGDASLSAPNREGELFSQARRLVRWHYQWVVIHDFLPRICGTKRMGRILGGQRRTPYHHQDQYIPVEFGAAAYRYGHSQVPGRLATNNPGNVFDLFSDQIGHGFTPVQSADDIVNWSLFFEVGPGQPQRARKLDIKLASTLLALPSNVVGADSTTPRKSLAVRNLLRGQTFGLASGQAIAAAMGLTPLTGENLLPDSVDEDIRTACQEGAPLWYYILREAQMERQGQKLGGVGAHLVAEVILGLIQKDPTSFIGSNPNWRPALPRTNAGKPAFDFDMVDLLAFAQV